MFELFHFIQLKDDANESKSGKIISLSLSQPRFSKVYYGDSRRSRGRRRGQDSNQLKIGFIRITCEFVADKLPRDAILEAMFNSTSGSYDYSLDSLSEKGDESRSDVEIKIKNKKDEFETNFWKLLDDIVAGSVQTSNLTDQRSDKNSGGRTMPVFTSASQYSSLSFLPPSLASQRSTSSSSSPSSSSSSHVKVVNENVLVASVEFSRPFAYSSSTWSKDQTCLKNLSLIRPAKPVRSQYGRQTTSGSSLPVDLTLKSYNDSFFYYVTSSESRQPYIKLFVPGIVGGISNDFFLNKCLKNIAESF